MQLLLPLLTETRWSDDENVALPLGPILRDDDTRLDCLPETDLVGKDHSRQKGRLKREECRINLVRLGLHLRVEQKAGKLAHVVTRVTALQFVRVVLRLILGEWMRHSEAPSVIALEPLALEEGEYSTIGMWSRQQAFIHPRFFHTKVWALTFLMSDQTILEG